MTGPAPDVVATQLSTGEVVLLNLDSAEYVTLNKSGTFIWACIEDGLSPSEIAVELSAAFVIDEDDARASVHAFLARLTASGLVTEPEPDRSGPGSVT